MSFSLSAQRLAALAAIAGACLTLAVPASAQLAQCINQCNSIGYQCESSAYDNHDRCVAAYEDTEKSCEREANDRRNYCYQNKAPSCDLGAQNTYHSCMMYVRPCEQPDINRCQREADNCAARCEAEARASVPQSSPAPRRSNAAPTTASDPNIQDTFYASFVGSSQRNEFQILDDDHYRVRNLNPLNGPAGKWFEYVRIDENTLKATDSDATYTQLPNGDLIWRGNNTEIRMTIDLD